MIRGGIIGSGNDRKGNLILNVFIFLNSMNK